MRRPLVLLVLLLALVLAGCGGGDDKGGSDGGGGGQVTKQEYGKQLAAAGETLQKTFASISDQTSGETSAKEVGQRLGEGAKALDQTVAKFKAITPPAAVKAAHDKLVAGLGELADIFRKGATAATKNDTASLTKALQGLSSSDGVKKITEAQQELKKAGVTLTTTTSK
jgi:hypothetical protein